MKIPNIKTYNSDGRKSVKNLYDSFFELENYGWISETICSPEGVWQGKGVSLPVTSFRTPKKGKAIWILSGIHGEEPAGPNAISEGIKDIQKLGKKFPVVLIPLCNPLGYLRNWRYLNQEKWSAEIEGKSVGDSDHYLPKTDNSKQPRLNSPSSLEAKVVTEYLINLMKDYPPMISFDFHEDDLISEGYIYSQGKMGEKDMIAKKVVRVLSDSGIQINKNGVTRFDEKIYNGVVGSSNDGSIDELISAEKIFYDGKIIKKPFAKTVLVIETPAKNLILEKRKNAHLEVLKSIEKFI
jgi:hypothetical protein